MRIGRHFTDVANPNGTTRRVHYRRAGSGPPLLMVHQSPRSSAEYAGLMAEWAAHFTCIAPDTPGFGQSDALPGAAEIDQFGDAVVALLDALGLGRVAAYGFHSGGIILMNALRRHPNRFSALAIGGYAIWTSQEMAVFGAHYLPPFVPQAYGEHLAWLWSRMLEQSWFFPWFDTRDAARLLGAHADVARVDTAVMEMLDAGDAYRAGYGAVLRAPRDIPPAEAMTPPVLITAYDGDPLQAHIDRLGVLPRGWQAAKVATQAEHRAQSLDLLRRHATGPTPALVETADAGFLPVTSGAFDGLLHWRGDPRGRAVTIHDPGAALDPGNDALQFDLPGHGLSDDWREPPTSLDEWVDVATLAVEGLGCNVAAVHLCGAGLSRPLAERVAVRTGGNFHSSYRPRGDLSAWRAYGLPDLTPDANGGHLLRAWQAVRAMAFFDPWFAPAAANARAFDAAEIAPQALASRHRDMLRARRGRLLLHHCLDAFEGD